MNIYLRNSIIAAAVCFVIGFGFVLYYNQLINSNLDVGVTSHLEAVRQRKVINDGVYTLTAIGALAASVITALATFLIQSKKKAPEKQVA